MTSSVAGGEDIFGEKCVFFPLFRQKKSKKCGQKVAKCLIITPFWCSAKIT